MLCVQEIYETYKKDVDTGRINLYNQIGELIGQVCNKVGMYTDRELYEDLKNYVFIKIDKKILEGKGNIALRTFSYIKEFIGETMYKFYRVPKDKIGGDYYSESMYEQKESKMEVDQEDFIRGFMNKNLSEEENIVISVKYFSEKKNKVRDIYKYIGKIINKSPQSVRKIEKAGLEKIKDILIG